MKFFIKIIILISVIPVMIFGANKKYDQVVQFNSLEFHYDKIDKKSKIELLDIIDKMKEYKANSQKMKIEISFFLNGVGEDNAEYIKEVLVENNFKKKRIRYKSYLLKDEDKTINNIGIKLYLNLEKDKDNDGIELENDKCPNTPKGFPVDTNGCTIPDEDNDGVMIENDKCPNTPQGFPVDTNGCTIADEDSDGVMIENDKCPDTPKGYEVDKQGCTISDKDQDGVMIENDKCLDTPLGTRVGNDGCELANIKLILKDEFTIKILKKNTSLSSEDRKKVQTLYYNDSGLDRASSELIEGILINMNQQVNK